MRLIGIILSLIWISAACCAEVDSDAVATCIWKENPQTSIYFDNDKTWEPLRWGMLMQVDYQPFVIVNVKNVEDIRASINCARLLNIPIVPRNGGHSFMGHSSVSSGILLSLSSYNDVLEIELGESEGSMIIESGASFGDLYKQLIHRTNGTFIFGGGTEPSVGLSGHTLCVGYGPFSRYTGASMDQVTGYEMMTVEGSLILANDKENSDLFNVLKGSCMSAYGIITKVYLRLTRMVPRLTYVYLDFRNNISAAASAFSETFYYTSQLAPVEFTTVYTISINGGFTFEGMYLGNLEQAKSAIDPVLSKVSNLPSPFIYTEMSVMEANEKWSGKPLNEWEDLPPVEGRRRRVCKAGYITQNPTLNQVTSLFSLYLPSGVHSTQIKVFGGKANETKSGIWLGRYDLASYHSCITFSNETERADHQEAINTFNQGWTNTISTRPQCTSYIEYTPTWQEDLYGSYYPSMIAMKTRYDPGNLFNNAMGVQPAST